MASQSHTADYVPLHASSPWRQHWWVMVLCAFLLCGTLGLAGLIAGNNDGRSQRTQRAESSAGAPLLGTDPREGLRATGSASRLAEPRAGGLTLLEPKASDAGVAERPAGEQLSDPCGDPPGEPDELLAAFDHLGSGWVTGDLMEHVQLGEAQGLWIFGDTFLGELGADGRLEPGWTMARSTAVLQSGGCFEVILGQNNGSWIPSSQPGAWRWPQEALVVDGELYVFAINLVSAPNDAYAFNWEQVGGSIMVYDLENLQVPRMTVTEVPDLRGKPFGWGAHIFGGHIYLYAHEQQTGTFVSRVRVNQLLSPTEWTFWDGSSWVSDVDEAVSVSTDRLRVFPHGDGFRAAALPFWDQRLHLFRSDSPTGPWQLTDIVELDSVYPDVSCYVYEPCVVQPVIATGGGDELTIAVNFLPTSSAETLADLRRYGPRFITVVPSG